MLSGLSKSLSSQRDTMPINLEVSLLDKLVRVASGGGDMEEGKLAALESLAERGDQFVHAIDPLPPGA